MIVGSRIDERIRALHTSQAKLARVIGVSPTAISKMVNGETYDSRRLYQIARELETSPEYLTGETDDPSIDAMALALTSQDHEWLALLHAMPPKEREAALLLIRTIAYSARSPLVNEPKGGE